jgi:hypothetical protein
MKLTKRLLASLYQWCFFRFFQSLLCEEAMARRTYERLVPRSEHPEQKLISRREIARLPQGSAFW